MNDFEKINNLQAARIIEFTNKKNKTFQKEKRESHNLCRFCFELIAKLIERLFFLDYFMLIEENKQFNSFRFSFLQIMKPLFRCHKLYIYLLYVIFIHT